MRRSRRIGAVLGGVGLLMGLAWLAHSPGEGLCDTTVLRELPSPSARFKAVLLSRDCGATTGFNRHVQVLRATEAPGDDSPFVIDDNRGKSTLDVEMRWESNDLLVVHHDAQARVFRAEHSARGVAMRYETLLRAGLPR